MTRFTTTHLDEIEGRPHYQAPRDASGVTWSKALNPPGYSLWLCYSALEDGATLSWVPPHGDDGIYVLDGALDVEGRRAPAGGAVIVESKAVATVRAVGVTRILHAGTASDEPPADGVFGPVREDGHGVHVIGPAGRFVSGRREGVNVIWFADSTCETCRLSMFVVDCREEKKGPPHHHSQDEIIYILDGSITMGRAVYGRGSSLCIPAGTRYGFQGGVEGHRFFNFRADVSHQVNDRSQPGLLETAMARGGRPIDDRG
jgi:mannose-6-phosphate isomerase-like protein (cupin superfamily)